MTSDLWIITVCVFALTAWVVSAVERALGLFERWVNAQVSAREWSVGLDKDGSDKLAEGRD